MTQQNNIISDMLVPFDLRAFIRKIMPFLEGRPGYVIKTVEGAELLINRFTADRLPQQLEERGITLFTDKDGKYHAVHVDEDIDAPGSLIL